MAGNPWQDILDQHLSIVVLLETHASLLLDSMQQNFAANNVAKDLLQERLVKTETLLTFFKDSAEQLGEASGNATDKWASPDATTPSSNRQTHPSSTASKPTIDSSGLFSVDTNPTPLDRLYQPKATGKAYVSPGTKRKFSEQDMRPIGSEAAVFQRESKRPRSQERPESRVEEADDSFDRGVQARLKAKEQRNKERENKKRKRQSDGSTSSVNIGSVKGPKNKKQKQVHEKKAQAAKAQAKKPLEIRPNNGNKRSNAGPVNGGTQPNKKRKKSR